MKKYVILALSLLLALPALSFPIQQDKDNLAYLENLDQNIIHTIEVIAAFNEIAGNMAENTEGAANFSRYLLDLTLECSTIRTTIAKAADLDAKERETAIRLIFDTIKPHDIDLFDLINLDQDNKNRQLLDEQITHYQEKIRILRSSIILEEKNISEQHHITSRYVALHNTHFIYHLILDFVTQHHLLSRQNRLYLINLILAVEEGISQSVK